MSKDNEPVAHGTFVEFRESAGLPHHSTRRWWVQAKRDNFTLGLIKWYPGWRCYAFFPQPDTTFEKKCLREIADFCEDMTAKQKVKLNQ